MVKNILLFYNQAVQARQQGQTLRTAEDIAPPNLAFGQSMADVIKLWGKPRASFSSGKAGHNIDIIFYRRDLIYENALLQLQFYNDQLFFFCMEVGKSMMSESSKLTMLSKILPNYITPAYPSVHSIPIIEDVQQHFILVKDDVVLNVCYLSGDFAADKLALIEEAQKYTATNEVKTQN